VFAESLSFTPRHSLAEHRPLGGLNRARLGVYQPCPLCGTTKKALRAPRPRRKA